MNKAKTLAVLAVLLLLSTLFAACGTPAPSGMYHPLDTEEYVNGVKDFAFAVPEGYEVTISSNMLAAVGEKDSFSVQTRHSDYYYQNGLEENYKELKKQLTALYGDFEEKKTADLTVAEQNALRVDYELTVAGVACGYTQYLFYRDTTAFYLFTYTYEPGKADEQLLKSVLDTISFTPDTFSAPKGYKRVENAAAESLSSDRYLLYCPDEWIFDNTLGQICIRVPSSTIISSISLNEQKLEGSFADYAEGYAKQVAPDAVWGEGELSAMEKYMLATLYQMSEVLPEFKLHTVTGEEEEDEGEEQPLSYTEIKKEDLVSMKDAFLQTLTTDQGIKFSYVDFCATLSDHKAHGSGGLFVQGTESEDEDEAKTAVYSFRQYFVVKDGYLYFFTYTASLDQYKTQLEDAEKVIDNFEFIEKSEK